MKIKTPDLWFSLVRMQRVVSLEIGHRLSLAGMPNQTWCDALLAVESGPGGQRRMHELAEMLAIPRSTVTRLVDRLENDGLVSRIRSPVEHRAVNVSITDKGRALRQEMWPGYRAAIDALFSAHFGTDASLKLFNDAVDRTAQLALLAQPENQAA